MKRFHVGLAFEATIVLYACSIALGLDEASRAGLQGLNPRLILIGVPASASLLFLTVTLLVPSLLGDGRMRFPLNLTLPAVHTVFVRVAVVLWTTTPSVLMPPPMELLPAFLWERMKVLILLFAVEAVALSVAVLARTLARGTRGPISDEGSPS